MTYSIDFKEIIIKETRQRREFEAESLTDLANSIAKIGLLHLPVLREEGGKKILVAGERRLRAMGQLWIMGEGVAHNGTKFPSYVVPYSDLGELDELSAEEAELDENLRRIDLTWQERAMAVDRLHKLRQKQAEAVGAVHKLSDTVAEVTTNNQTSGRYYSEVRNNIILADHMDNAEVAKAKTADEAMKILKRSEERRKNAELALRIGKNFNSSIHELHHGDCTEWLKTCSENSFDVICTDPPYGMGAQNFNDAGGMLADSTHSYDDSKSSWSSMIKSLCPLLYKVAKPQAHAYIFCDIDNFHELKAEMIDSGWYVFRTPLINYKPRSGRIPLPEHGPKRQWEMCLYAIKGRKPVTGVFSDVISSILTEEGLKHGAQKPVELYVDLLKRSVRPGDTVIDPFAGTGTIFPAAHALKCKAVGIEKDPSYYGVAIQRLNALDKEPELI